MKTIEIHHAVKPPISHNSTHLLEAPTHHESLSIYPYPGLLGLQDSPRHSILNQLLHCCFKTK